MTAYGLVSKSFTDTTMTVIKHRYGGPYVSLSPVASIAVIINEMEEACKGSNLAASRICLGSKVLITVKNTVERQTKLDFINLHFNRPHFTQSRTACAVRYGSPRAM